MSRMSRAWCAGVATIAGCIVAAPVARAQDTAAVRKTEQGILVDFQDADIRTVITALAEAGGLNVSYTDLPAKRTTLHLREPVSKAAIGGILKSLALTNGLSYSEEPGGLIRLSVADVTAGGRAGDSSMKDAKLFVLQLKHARAARMAGTLQSIFGGARTNSTTTPGLTTQSLTDRLRGQQIAPFSPDTAARSVAAALGGTVLSAQLRGDIQIVPDETTNALLIRALPADYQTIRQAVEAMDLRPMQALIEVVIAEVRITNDLELGMSGNLTTGSTTGTGNSRSAALTSTAATDFVLKLTQLNSNFTADLALAALASRGTVRILSRPIILAQNNSEAKILVGEQRPFVQVFRSLPTDNSVRDQVVQYRDVATTLTILPTINPDGYVNLQVLQEVSAATTEVQFGAPVISTREASTHLFVKDGQTAVIGGLVGRQTSRTRSGIPILSSIPWIGALFGTQIENTTNNELFLFLTPHVIATDEDADRIRNSLKREGTDSTGVAPGEKPIIGKPGKP